MDQIKTDSQEQLLAWVNEQPLVTNEAVNKWVDLLVANDAQTKTFNMHSSSYGLKHFVEGISEALVGKRTYVQNEEIIVALLRAGFIARNVNYRTGMLSANYHFNVSKLVLKDIEASLLDTQKS